MTDTNIKLPTEPYTITLAYHGKPSDHKVEPLSDACLTLIDTLHRLGVSVRLDDAEKPSSIFFDYTAKINPIKVVNHEVLEVDLHLHLFLIGVSSERNAQRLQNFLTALHEVANGELPESYAKSDVRLITVARKYEF
jgi:hypothetical protein